MKRAIFFLILLSALFADKWIVTWCEVTVNKYGQHIEECGFHREYSIERYADAKYNDLIYDTGLQFEEGDTYVKDVEMYQSEY